MMANNGKVLVRSLRNCDLYATMVLLPNGRLETISFKCAKNVKIESNCFSSRIRLEVLPNEVGEAIAQEQQEEEEIQIIEQAGNEVGATAQEEREEEVIWEEGMHIVATANNEVRLYLARGIEKKRTRKQVRFLTYTKIDLQNAALPSERSILMNAFLNISAGASPGSFSAQEENEILAGVKTHFKSERV